MSTWCRVIFEPEQERNCARCRVGLALSWTIPRVVPVVVWVDCIGVAPVSLELARVKSMGSGVYRYPVGRTQGVERVIFPVP